MNSVVPTLLHWFLSLFSETNISYRCNRRILMLANYSPTQLQDHVHKLHLISFHQLDTLFEEFIYYSSFLHFYLYANIITYYIKIARKRKKGWNPIPSIVILLRTSLMLFLALKPKVQYFVKASLMDLQQHIA